jgi:hypothetical protein
METKIARYISPAAIAITLFLAVALLPRGATITASKPDNGGVNHSAKHSAAAAAVHTKGE